MELRVGNRYRLGRKIGSGSFGEIYLGTVLNTPSYITFSFPELLIYYHSVGLFINYFKLFFV